VQFPLTDEQRLIQNTAREFADSEIAPVADQHNREGKFPAALVKRMGELGFLGMLVPEAYGGSGIGNFGLVVALEEVNRVCASTGVTMSVQNSLVCAPVVHWGSEAIKKKYLPKLASGEALGAYALSEPGSGSDAAALVTSAVKDGDSYVLNGTKNFITSGAEADFVIAMVRTDPAHKTRGITAFVVESD
jgi:alkylation response protein AidB-like acyl-CoA dehydrogenase